MADGKHGGIFKGALHKNGGIKAVVLTDGGGKRPIEVEADEVIIARKAVLDEEPHAYYGTHKEILSQINQSGGGVEIFEEGGAIGGSLESACAKFGWTAKETKDGFELFNRNEKAVVDIKIKGDKYIFSDKAGNKLMSGKGKIGESAEKLIEKYYFGKRIEVKKKGGNTKIDVKATNTVDLIREGSEVGSRTVRVVFIPAYDKELHKYTNNKELIDSLKKSKVEYFDIVNESTDITDLVKNPKDVKSITWEFTEGIKLEHGGNLSECSIFGCDNYKNIFGC